MKKYVTVDITQQDLLEEILVNRNTNKYDMYEIARHVLCMMAKHDNMPIKQQKDWWFLVNLYRNAFERNIKELKITLD